MVVLRPVLAGERLRRCSGCSHVGLESPVRERTSYSRTTRLGRLIFVARCRRCESLRAAAYAKRNLERTRAARREFDRRRRLDPEIGPRIRERDRERKRRERATGDGYLRAYERWVAKVRADPERYREFLDKRRIDARLRRERKGLGSGRERTTRESGRRLDPAPFRAWLLDLHERVRDREETLREGALDTSALEEATGVSARRLRDVLVGRALSVYEDTVERALVRVEGPDAILRLYPELAE